MVLHIERTIEDRMVELTSDQRLLVIDQATILLSEFYVHLPQKESGKAIRPLQRLRLLRSRVEQENLSNHYGSVSRPTLSHLQFHEEMIAIFASLKDVHTQYTAAKGSDANGNNVDLCADLNFNIRAVHYPACEKCGVSGKTCYVVSDFDRKRREETLHSKGETHNFGNFDNGVYITHWNGVTIERAIEMVGESLYGANEDAVTAQGIQAMTRRLLTNATPPIEDVVTLTYVTNPQSDSNFQAYDIKFPWEFEDQLATNSQPRRPEAISSFNTICHQEITLPGVNVNNHFCACPPDVPKSTVYPLTKYDAVPAYLIAFPESNAAAEHADQYGYMRVYSFNTNNLRQIVADNVRNMSLHVQNTGMAKLKGLIIDIRDNEGGVIESAEEILQVLSRSFIEPTDFQVRATTSMLKLARHHSLFSIYHHSLEESVRTGELFSAGRWLRADYDDELKSLFASYSADTELFAGFESGNDNYLARTNTVLIVNAHSYSASDIFAAAFNDFDLGELLGTDGKSGAGGGNVYSHKQLLRDFQVPGLNLKELPTGINMKVSVKRALRRGRNTGLPLEDIGVLIPAENRTYLEAGDFDPASNDLNIVLLKKATRLVDQISRSMPEL